MSRITVNLEQPEVDKSMPNAPLRASVMPMTKPEKKRRGLWIKILLALLILFFVGAAILGAFGYFWWSNLQKSPSYSLALLIDAARRDDKTAIEKYLDTNAMVDDFVPQVIEKAKERYGRGFPPAQVQQAEQRAQSLLTQVVPSIKERARAEIPRLIRDKAQNIPAQFSSPWAMAIGINRAAVIEQTGDAATVKTDLQSRQIELKMQKNGEVWRVVGFKDDVLADKIADQAAQKILALVNQKQTAGRGIPNNKDLIEELKKQIQFLTP
jgi:nitrate reductase NapE component